MTALCWLDFHLGTVQIEVPTVRLPPNCPVSWPRRTRYSEYAVKSGDLTQRTSFLEPNVTWCSTNQPRHCMPVMVLRHIDVDPDGGHQSMYAWFRGSLCLQSTLFVVEQELSQALHSSVCIRGQQQCPERNRRDNTPSQHPWALKTRTTQPADLGTANLHARSVRRRSRPSRCDLV